MRVIKIGGRAQEHPDLPGVIADAWRAASGALCVVHGGGNEVSALQRTLGVTPAFIDGRRVTNDADIVLLRMALSGAANKRLVAALGACGVRAVGLSGEDGALIAARRASDERLGRVGEPTRIEVRLLWALLDAGFLPVISPLGRDRTSPTGDALNVNADDAATAIAVALAADELLLIADVPGVFDASGQVVDVLDVEATAALIEQGTAAGGMHAKLEAAAQALAHGVSRVRIGDLAAVSDGRRGTRLTPTIHAPSFA